MPFYPVLDMKSVPKSVRACIRSEGVSQSMHTDRRSTFLQADTLLPPDIQGPAKGELLLLFRWTSAPEREALASSSRPHAVVTWWGQRNPSANVSLEEHADTGLVYTVTCGPKAFGRYLKDMQRLKLKFVVQHNRSESTVQGDVDVCKLDFSTPMTSRTAVAAPDGRLLGTAVVHISMSYSPLVSSFEKNEHLASIDHNMPLFPTSQRIVTPLRQLNLQSSSNATSAVSAVECVAIPISKHQLPSSNAQSPAYEGADQTDKLLVVGFSQLLRSLNRCACLF